MRLTRRWLAGASVLLLAVGLNAQSWQFPAQARSNGSFLGVRMVDIDTDRARTLKLSEDRGVEVTMVEEGSPADAAGLRPGDVLLNYNGENILGAQQFVRLVQETPPGRKVKFQVWRAGRTQTLLVTMGAPRTALEVPPNFIAVVGDSAPSRTFMDTPNPLLLWKNSLLGFECEEIDSQLAQYFGVKRGVLVRSVDRGSAGDKAGVRAGDVLIAIGDHTLSSPHDISSYLRMEHEPGRPVSFSLMRDHKELTLNVALMER